MSRDGLSLWERFAVTPAVEECIKLVTITIAIGTFWKSLLEYRKQGAAKRAEQFLTMRSRLRGNPLFVRICDLLESDSPDLKELSLIDRDNFTGFFEEVALLWNSRVLNDRASAMESRLRRAFPQLCDHVVYYMFSYFALKCSRSSNFWVGLNRQQSTWDPFNNFVTQLEKVEAGFARGEQRYSASQFRL